MYTWYTWYRVYQVYTSQERDLLRRGLPADRPTAKMAWTNHSRVAPAPQRQDVSQVAKACYHQALDLSPVP